jgi:3-oxo-5-alpha-steroid 4-dehydrogenase 1
MTIYRILVLAELALSVMVFILLFFINAPYGRFVRKGWGPTLRDRWAWVAMELPAMLVILIAWLMVAEDKGLVAALLLGMWEIHYCYRVLVYPLLKEDGGRQFPWLLVFFALIFNSTNGWLNAMALCGSSNLAGTWWLSDWRFLVGVPMFFAGMAIHMSSDTHLRHLRRNKPDAYQIPDKGFFRLVSNPHYFGEILEWCGWAVATWSLAGVAFAVFTFANLAPRAWAHHRWYHRQFPDYPPQRKALIPFVW